MRLHRILVEFLSLPNAIHTLRASIFAALARFVSGAFGLMFATIVTCVFHTDSVGGDTRIDGAGDGELRISRLVTWLTKHGVDVVEAVAAAEGEAMIKML